MSLQVWLPLTGDLHNQGLSDANITNTSATINNSGKIGKCYSFGTAKSYFKFDNVDFMHNFSECSISLWINILTWNTSYATYFQFGLGSTPWAHYIFGLLRNNAASTLCFTISNGSSATNANCLTPTLELNTWYHLTFTYANGHCKIYVNGENTKDYTTTIVPNFAGITTGIIGACNNGSNYQANCLMNDFRIYDHCLSDKEIEEISKGLVLHYKLDDAASIETTINLCNGSTCGTQASAASPSTWGAHKYYTVLQDTTENDPVPFQKKSVMTIDYNTDYGSNGGASVYPPAAFAIEPSTTYIYSKYIKPSDDFVYTNANFLYRYEYASGGGTRLIEGGVFNKTNTEYLGNGWYRCWGTFTSQATAATVVLPFYTYPGKSMIYELGGIQLEKSDHITPYTASTNTSYIIDSSGYGYNGDSTNATTTSITRRFSKAAVLNGTTVDNSSNTKVGAAYIRGFITLTTPSVLTVAWWGKNDAYGRGGIFQTSINDDPSECTDYNTTAIANWDTTFRVYNGSTAVNFFSSFIKDGAWHHHVIVYDGTQVRYYCDGIQKANSALTGTLPTFNGFCMGLGKAGGVYRQIKETVADLRIYVTGLTADQVKELYNTSASIDKNGNTYARELVEK